MSEFTSCVDYGTEPIVTATYPKDGLFYFKEHKMPSPSWVPDVPRHEGRRMIDNWEEPIEWIGFYPYRYASIDQGTIVPRILLRPLESWCQKHHAEIKKAFYHPHNKIHMGRIENKWVGIFHARGNAPFAIYFKDDWACIGNGSCVKLYEAKS